jgi:hypothetical protein
MHLRLVKAGRASRPLLRSEVGGTGAVELLIVVALIAMAAVAGVRVFGSSVQAKTCEEAGNVAGIGGGGGGAACGPSAAADVLGIERPGGAGAPATGTGGAAATSGGSQTGGGIGAATPGGSQTGGGGVAATSGGSQTGSGATMSGAGQPGTGGLAAAPGAVGPEAAAAPGPAAGRRILDAVIQAPDRVAAGVIDAWSETPKAIWEKVRDQPLRDTARQVLTAGPRAVAQVWQAGQSVWEDPGLVAETSAAIVEHGRQSLAEARRIVEEGSDEDRAYLIGAVVGMVFDPADLLGGAGKVARASRVARGARRVRHRETSTLTNARPQIVASDVLGEYAPGTGFSGAYNPETGSFVALASDGARLRNGQAAPTTVPRRGGHYYAEQALMERVTSTDTRRNVGFTLILQDDGKLRVNWTSGQINSRNFPGAGNRQPPADVRPPIIEAIKAATGRDVVE